MMFTNNDVTKLLEEYISFQIEGSTSLVWAVKISSPILFA